MIAATKVERLPFHMWVQTSSHISGWAVEDCPELCKNRTSWTAAFAFGEVGRDAF